MLLDIATEELSHLEVIGSIVAMLNKGVKANLAEGAMAEAELYREIGASGVSAKEALLFGGGPALIDSAGVPWTAAYVDSRSEPTVDLRSNIAAESRARDRMDELVPADGSEGLASVGLDKGDLAVVEALAARTMSDPSLDPTTGADLGAGPGAGRTTEGDMGGAKDVNEAAKMAQAMTVKP
jgi:hypothetical protein